jgi:hypothetical protein
MLARAPVMINFQEAEEVESLRSVLQLNSIIRDLAPTKLGDAFVPMVFASFMKILPTVRRI